MTNKLNGMDELFCSGKEKTLCKGEVLHDNTESCEHMGFIKSGQLRFTRILASGKEILLKEFNQGDYFADLQVFSGNNYPGWLIATQETVVIEVGLNSLLNHLKKEDLILNFLKEVSNKVTGLTQSLEIMSYRTIKQKLAHTFLFNKKILMDGKNNLTVLSMQLNCSREALSRGISKLESEKIISRSKDGFLVLKEAALEEILFSDD